MSRTTTTPALRGVHGAASSRLLASRYSAVAGPSGGQITMPSAASRMLADAVSAKTPSGDRRHATRGTVASVTSTTRAASRLLVREWTTPVRPSPPERRPPSRRRRPARGRSRPPARSRSRAGRSGATPPRSAKPQARQGTSAAGESLAWPVVAVERLTKHYGRQVAVDDLTFSLDRGMITGCLGPTGAGKTTTLRVLLGLAEPTAGTALVFGRRYPRLDHPARTVGAVLESSDFHPGRSGRNHLRVLALAAGIPFSRVEEVLDMVMLASAAARPVRSYSLGMRQRLRPPPAPPPHPRT